MTYRTETLGAHRDWIPTLANWHFEYWGPLTGFETVDTYRGALARWSLGDDMPAVLVAVDGAELAGSVNLLRSEMKTRPDLRPWLAQLFVAPRYRRSGVGAALVRAAIAQTGRCGFGALHLYTSGTLPRHYASLGWSELERVHYLGKERAVMRYDIARALAGSDKRRL